MEKNLVESYKNQYVKLVKDSGEVLDGAIVEIMDNNIIFQTEFGRSAISVGSIKEITSHEEMKKRKRTSEFKI